jgi:hypothetical protein
VGSINSQCQYQQDYWQLPGVGAGAQGVCAPAALPSHPAEAHAQVEDPRSRNP